MFSVKNLEIYKNQNNNICLSQTDNYNDDVFVIITPDMVDLVCEELQKLKTEIKKEVQD